MRKEFYLNLVILCGFWSQGIAVISNETIGDRNYKSPTDQLIRKKRIINKSQGGTLPAHVTLSRHLVQIQELGEFQCAGNILQTDIILIPRSCFNGGIDRYSVLSGSMIKNTGTRHRIVRIESHPISNIALLLIRPSITLSPRGNDKIKLFRGFLDPNSFGLFSGWGCVDISPTGERIYPTELMATLLPIISHQECYRAIIRFHLQIPSTDILCTLDPRREKGACYGDEGGSLVYNNHLLGIYSHNGGVNLGVHPDIYVKVSDEKISQWINIKTQNLQRIGVEYFRMNSF